MEGPLYHIGYRASGFHIRRGRVAGAKMVWSECVWNLEDTEICEDDEGDEKKYGEDAIWF